MRLRPMLHRARLGVLLSALLPLSACVGFAAPGIVITNLPPYGSVDNLAGAVYGVDPLACRVAVFIYVPGYGWASKPSCAQALSPIRTNGSWGSDITTGGVDSNATRVAAFLVRSNYNEPCVLGAPFLTNVYPQALASAVVTRPVPGARWVNFSGYDWWVKTGTEKVGPGPNYFSGSTNNVWVDGLGQLHLRVTHRSDQWQCAELVTGRTFGYGSYRFELASRVDTLDPGVVLGLFTWSDDPAYAYREIDVECSRWGNEADTNNAQFVVQPWDAAGHLLRYAVPGGLTNSTHFFTWQSNRVGFQCLRGSYSANPSVTNLVRSWVYTGTVPQTGDENIRINLWLVAGHAPLNNQETEVVIKSFQFVPLGTPPPARLSGANRRQPGPFQFLLSGVPDWRYQVQVSANLVDWAPWFDVLATNSVIRLQGLDPSPFASAFYRTRTLP